jgi:hypothetical protein
VSRGFRSHPRSRENPCAAWAALGHRESWTTAALPRCYPRRSGRDGSWDFEHIGRRCEDSSDTFRRRRSRAGVGECGRSALSQRPTTCPRKDAPHPIPPYMHIRRGTVHERRSRALGLSPVDIPMPLHHRRLARARKRTLTKVHFGLGPSCAGSIAGRPRHSRSFFRQARS